MKKRWNFNNSAFSFALFGHFVVKVARIELASESISTRPSPSAANVLLFRLGQRPLADFDFG